MMLTGMNSSRLALVLGAALAVPSVALADDGGPADIVVVASGVAQPADSVAQSVTVLDRELIEQRQTVSVADLIATTPGVAVARNGGAGGLTSLFVRGAESDQVLVLIDGVRANDQSSPTGAYDFGSLQTGSIDRIEILRGANSTIWGSQALGGVVNIITAVPPESGVIVDANAEYGANDTGQASARVGYATGPVTASLGGAWYSTDGISATTADDERDGNEQYQINGRVDVRIAEGFGIDLRGFHSHSDLELDGFSPEGVTKQSTLYAGGRAGLLDGSLNLRAGYSLSDIRRSNDSAFGTSRFKGRAERAEFRGDWRTSEKLWFVFGAENEWTSADNSFLLAEQRSRLTSFYGQVQLMPVEGLTLTGGARHDDHRQFGGETSFSAGAAWRIGATRLRASYAEGFKAPALDQLFADYGNVGLTPERSRNIDAGIEQSFLDGRVIAAVTWFDRKTTDQIVYFSCSTNPDPLCDGRGTFGAYYRNVRRTTADGVEAELTVRPAESLVLRANYTFLNARNRSAPFDGLQLPRRPRQSLNASLDWSQDRYALGTTVRLAGESFDNIANSVRLDGYVVADVRASVEIADGISLYGRVENLFDTDYATAFGFRTLGRSAYGGIRVTL